VLLLAIAHGGAAHGDDSPESGYFSDESVATGLVFRHLNGMSGQLYLPEIMGGGAALFDYDNDGDLDVYLVQGGPIGSQAEPPGGIEASDRLFRNDLGTASDGRPILRFTDVTVAAGVMGRSYGMGVATGDFDNDGWVDLYVTNFGVDQLLRNQGDGSFRTVTRSAGLGDPSWGVSASFFDYDRDGLLDLFVGNYLTVDLTDHKPCRSPSSAPDYCTPLVYKAQSDRLYHNLGSGRFEDVTASSRIGSAFGRALGVIATDANRDGWLDVYVANDATANQLWINRKDGSFDDTAMLAGAAVDMAGRAQGSMGLAAGDPDNDGDEDLFMTHLTGESNTIYVNDGQGWFDDRSIGTGLAGASMAFTGFGAGWLDFDNDGWLDVFVANGEVSLVRGLSASASGYPLDQPNQLFRNRGGGRFSDDSELAGPAVQVSEVSRGVAFGDVDNDGDTDVLVHNNNGIARLLINQVGQGAHWIGMRVVDGHGRDAYGARIELRRDGKPTQWRTVHSDGSYASASDPRILFGLGGEEGDPSVRVHWLGGRVEEWTGVAANRYTVLRYGQGRVVAEP